MVILLFYQIVTHKPPDKFICSDSGFYDLLERDDDILAEPHIFKKHFTWFTTCLD